MDHAAPSTRAAILFRRTYNRPLDEAGTRFETFRETIARVKEHQRWLWERHLGDSLVAAQEQELDDLEEAMLQRQVAPAGRTLWLGGTELVKRREASSFNCSAIDVRTVHDLVDAFWMLLQGAGVGFRPVNGALSGFTRKMEVEVVRSTRTGTGGNDHNVETYDQKTGLWTIQIGDSAEAWAKSIGKLVAGKFPAKKLRLDFSQLRPAGTRLKGYGWLCTGDSLLVQAYEAICGIMNANVGRLLSKNAIVDIVNWLGTVLSNRRSAQLALMDYGDPEWREFAARKPPGFDKGPMWFRGQSNNSLCFYEKPTRRQIRDIFEMMAANGGSEPGFINGAQALLRAPWFRLLNPCAEVILSNNGVCNLVEQDVARFKGDAPNMHRTLALIARANYRQTVVDLNDGVLQSSWHQQNQYLRLCGVGLTGIARRPDMNAWDYRQLRNTAVTATYNMADEMGLERPKNVTVTKPSGTLSKAFFDTTEGLHKPKARHIFNHVGFSKHDPLVPRLQAAGYKVIDHPYDISAVLVTLPVTYPDVPLDNWNGYEVDRESAVTQLERYRMLNTAYVDQNSSITVSWDPAETKALVDWFDRNWDSYVATAFLFRADPTRTAEQMGYSYLPQMTVTAAEFEAYSSTLAPIDVEAVDEAGIFALDPAADECATGACPIK